MVIVIPGFVVCLIVMSQYLGGDSNPIKIKGFWEWTGAFLLAVCLI